MGGGVVECFVALIGFGAQTSSDQCASSGEVQGVAELVRQTKDEATAAKDQAAIAPESSATLAGLYRLAESEETVHLVPGVKNIGQVVPSDWECQSQARGGQYPCPDGEPSKCRYYHNTEYRDKAHCVYYYCTKHQDECCAYYDGTVHGTIEGNDYTMSSGTKITFGQFANEAQFANDFPNEPNASMVCASMVADLKTYDWWSEWFDDEPVSTAYLNFQITSMEFSHAYGLFLLSSKGDQLTIQKSSTTECMAPDAPDSCYNAWYKPESSYTAIPLKQNKTFSVGDQNELSERARRLGTVGSMQLPTSGYKMLTEKKPTLTTERKLREHNALTRFAGSCDKNKPGCAAMLGSDSLLVPTEEDEEGDRTQRHLEALSGLREPRQRGRELRRGGGGSFFSYGSFTLMSGNRAGNSR